MPAKDSLVYIMHIRDSCRRIGEYTTSGGNNWIYEPLIMDTVRRNITIIGEAARKLDDAFRQAHPEIPWSGLIGARNILMHAYEYLSRDLIKEMAENDVPELLAHSLTAFAFWVRLDHDCAISLSRLTTRRRIGIYGRRPAIVSRSCVAILWACIRSA